MNILVVEDEAPIRDWIIYNVSKLSDDYKVVGSASNGKEGLELAKGLKPDIIISDIKMPIMNGIDLIKYSNTPQLIACLAYSNSA